MRINPVINKSNAPSGYQRKWLAGFAVTLALTIAAAPASAQQPGIKNFGKVNDNYYRGAQPAAGQHAQLKRMGIKTVIDLRKEKHAGAREWARAAGLAYFNLPLEAGRPATDEQAAEFLRLVNDPANWPVYVHCDGGRTRTGALTSVYRITRDDWTADRAFDEMLKYGFDDSKGSSGLFGGDGRARQKRFVYAYYEQYASAKDPARAN